MDGGIRPHTGNNRTETRNEKGKKMIDYLRSSLDKHRENHAVPLDPEFIIEI